MSSAKWQPVYFGCNVLNRLLQGYSWFHLHITLQRHHNGLDSISNHQPHNCLPKRLFRRRSKKTSKLPVTGLCAGNSPETSEFPAQRANNTENVSIDDVIMKLLYGQFSTPPGSIRQKAWCFCCVDVTRLHNLQLWAISKFNIQLGIIRSGLWLV